MFRLKCQRTIVDFGLPRVTASTPSVGSRGTYAGHADAVLQLQRLYAATDQFVLCGFCATLKRRPGEDARNLPYLSLPRSLQSAPDRAWSGWARSHAALEPRGASGAAGGRFQLTMSASHCLAGRGRSAGYTQLAPHIQLVESVSTCASSVQPATVRQRQYPALGVSIGPRANWHRLAIDPAPRVGQDRTSRRVAATRAMVSVIGCSSTFESFWLAFAERSRASIYGTHGTHGTIWSVRMRLACASYFTGRVCLAAPQSAT